MENRNTPTSPAPYVLEGYANMLVDGYDGTIQQHRVVDGHELFKEGYRLWQPAYYIRVIKLYELLHAFFEIINYLGSPQYIGELYHPLRIRTAIVRSWMKPES